MLKHNYIVFYTNDERLPKYNPDGYQTLSLMDLVGKDDVHVVPYPLHHLPYILRWLYFACHSNKFKRLVSKNLEKLFFPFFFDKSYLSDKPLCVILIGGAHIPFAYYEYLKKTYPNSKLVFFYRDLVEVVKKGLSPDILHHRLIDVEMSFDNGEAKKYGMQFCPEYSSIVDLSEHSKYPSCDVFFCGQAKDRHQKLLAYYKYLTQKGLKCDFFITQVPEEEQEELEGVHYNQFLVYKEMLCRSYNACCLLDINQGGANGGYTSRFYEAIMYNTKLISDNPITIESSFYNGKDIIFVTKPEDITDEYIENISSSVNYNYNGEFSPMCMIERVEEFLNK